MSKASRSWLIAGAVLVLLLLAVGAFMLATSPNSFGNDPGKVVKWKKNITRSSPSPQYELAADTVPDPRGTVVRWTHSIEKVSVHQVSTDAGDVSGPSWCSNVNSWVRGENGIGFTIVSAHSTVHLCWRYGAHQFYQWSQSFHCDTSWLWTCDYLPGELVANEGWSKAVPGERYRYRRAYWRFQRGLPDIGIVQSAKAFVTGTYRTDGSVTLDNGQ